LLRLFKPEWLIVDLGRHDIFFHQLRFARTQ
jgi:hypothetical protein